MMDNRQFNVNGSGKEMLLAALRLAFSQEGSKTTAKCYILDPKKGMVFFWTVPSNSIATPLPAPFDADSAADFAWTWLQSKPEVECADWDADDDHDGHNSLGWRVYCENWGHVNVGSEDGRYAIIAVKPAFLWHGK